MKSAKLLVLVLSFVLVGCGSSMMPTAPTSDTARSAEPSASSRQPSNANFVGTPVIHNLSLESVRPHESWKDVSVATVRYGVEAHQCVIVFYQGAVADESSVSNRDFVDITHDGVIDFPFRTPNLRGDYLLELRCVDRPGAQEGAIKSVSFKLS
jgi:hypothetical protein